ncbi:hypothetical protein LSAT2_012450 [Lamellibrachia satsuma]|nr:hypothetical protein LSAT2_012450 [Lamellibrachia satsuma]
MPEAEGQVIPLQTRIAGKRCVSVLDRVVGVRFAHGAHPPWVRHLHLHDVIRSEVYLHPVDIYFGICDRGRNTLWTSSSSSSLPLNVVSTMFPTSHRRITEI